MELKYNNSSGEIVLACKLKLVQLFFWNCKICVQNWIVEVIFSRKFLDRFQTRLSITFSSLDQILQIKSFHIDKTTFYEMQNFES